MLWWLNIVCLPNCKLLSFNFIISLHCVLHHAFFRVSGSCELPFCLHWKISICSGSRNQRTIEWRLRHVEIAQFPKSNKFCDVMSSETGNLVQFMFHTKFPFDCDKYAPVQSQHRIPIQTPKIWLKQKSHLVDSCNLQILLTNSPFAANIQMRISFCHQVQSCFETWV